MNDIANIKLPSKRLWFISKYLNLPEATGDPDARLQPFQIEQLNDQSQFTIDNKARQVGWSWTAAAGACADSILEKRSTNIFVSINLDEAREKIRYAKYIIEALHEDVRPRLIIDNQTELEIDNGSRLISHPCRPVRGKARANVYLDEFAHYPKDREIYTSAIPATTRGGCIRIGSSPLGAGGMFWEIFAEKIQPFPGYLRRSIPWWVVEGLCKDIKMAKMVAPSMLTEERVRHFGTPRLIQIYENMVESDFQQEYELAWLDESIAWISWEEIKRNQIDAQEEKLWYRQAKGIDAAMAMIEEIGIAVKEGKIENAFAVGMDIGRHKNLSEIIGLGKGTTPSLPYRFGISLENAEFDDQKAVLTKLLDVLPVTKMLIDQTGLGMQLAEDMQKASFGRAEGITFTNPNKELWSVELKVRMQRGQVPLPLERELSYQIHSIKKKITAAKNSVFDTEGNEKHHADKYWALALAVWASGQEVEVSAAVVDPEEDQYHAERRPSEWQ
ncbi:MAG: terminase family protein [Anaerolineales bacterium]|nr:terminase family protein [Anaerolineales bacterium]